MRSGEPTHRFRVGQSVTLASGFGRSGRNSTLYKVIALLPSNGVHFQYRLRNSGEAFERVATENELNLARLAT